MPIDWSATGDMLSGIGALGGAAAVAWAAHRAANTLETWKRQKVAERKFEHAERTVAACHNAREALAYIRGPLIQGHELESARATLDQDGEWRSLDESRKLRFETAQVRIDRMKRTQDAQQELADCIPLAKALFDEKLEGALSELHRQFWIVRTWIDAAVEDTGTDREFAVEIRRELASDDPEKSKVAKAIQGSLTAVDEICLPVLRA